MSEPNAWQPIESAPEGVEVKTRVHDSLLGERNVQSLTRKGALWFHPDMSMYVYYRPTQWAPLPLPPEGTQR